MKIEAVRAGRIRIGGGARCFLIAEAGSNHDGSLAKALRLVDVAAAAGADAVKFQTFRAERIYSEHAGTSAYLKLKQSIVEIIRSMEMPYSWIPKLAARCRRRGVAFISTPFDEESADRLNPHLDVFKIASYEMTHHPLLRHVAAFGKPVILSTGASRLDEVAESVRVLRRARVRGLCLMQCTASYPAPLASINVRVVETLRRTFGVPAGLSDHSREPEIAPMAAVALGADLIEKHFTLDNRLPGPDHRYAVEPDELARLVRSVRATEEALGDGVKAVHPVERELRSFARRSVFALRDLRPGERLDRGNIACLRNGKMPAGLPPSEFEGVLGRRLRRAVRRGHAVTGAALGR
jgi:N-acetylneuraminate synthase